MFGCSFSSSKGDTLEGSRLRKLPRQAELNANESSPKRPRREKTK
jgi:hypothetical protein